MIPQELAMEQKDAKVAKDKAGAETKNTPPVLRSSATAL